MPSSLKARLLSPLDGVECPLIICVTLSQLLGLSAPPSPHLQEGSDDRHVHSAVTGVSREAPRPGRGPKTL